MIFAGEVLGERGEADWVEKSESFLLDLEVRPTNHQPKTT